MHSTTCGLKISHLNYVDSNGLHVHFAVECTQKEINNGSFCLMSEHGHQIAETLYYRLSTLGPLSIGKISGFHFIKVGEFNNPDQTLFIQINTKTREIKLIVMSLHCYFEQRMMLVKNDGSKYSQFYLENLILCQKYIDIITNEKFMNQLFSLDMKQKELTKLIDNTMNAIMALDNDFVALDIRRKNTHEEQKVLNSTQANIDECRICLNATLTNNSRSLEEKIMALDYQQKKVDDRQNILNVNQSKIDNDHSELCIIDLKLKLYHETLKRNKEQFNSDLMTNITL